MDVSSLIQQLTSIAEKGPEAIPGDDRSALLDACDKLRNALESPVETVMRMNWSVYEAAVFRVGIYMGVFDTAVAKGGPVTIQELAEPRKADQQLVRRIMRALASLHLFTQNDANSFTATPKAAAYVTPSPLSQGYMHLSSTGAPAMQMVEYFEKHGYKDPTDPVDGIWQCFWDTKGESYWDWQTKTPALKNAFNIAMSAQKMMRTEEWFEHWPVEKKLADVGKDRVALVDIGGNTGFDLKLFHEAFPNLPGKLVLEDMDLVISQVKDLPLSITPIAHNFFEPQPSAVRGAKVYYIRTVLHDWPDKEAFQILGNVKDAMAPDSILLVNEAMLPETGVDYYDALLDLHMMVSLAARERTEKEWVALLDKAGFKVREVSWPKSQIGKLGKALIECIPKE